MDLTAAVDDLYGASPRDFVATRTRLVAAAKEAGASDLAAELGSLRKPTVAAWLLNRVARDEPDVITELTALGERMRTAQGKGDGAALSAARPERQARVEALVAAAGRVAADHETTFGSTTADAVGATAIAALADRDSGGALASGRLLRPLSYAGFGEVELDDAVAVPLALVPPLTEGEDVAEQGQSTAGAEERKAARAREAAGRAHVQALAAAREALRDSERALSTARLRRSEAEQALDAASRRVADLDEEVAAASASLERLASHPDA